MNTPKVSKIDAWEVNGKFFPVKAQAEEAAQAYRLETLLKEKLAVNLNDNERNTIGWMILNKMDALKEIIDVFDNVLMKDKDFIAFMEGLQLRAKQIEDARLDQEKDSEKQKEAIMKVIKDSQGQDKGPNRKQRRTSTKK